MELRRYAYNEMGRLASISAYRDGSWHDQFDYAYDDAWRLHTARYTSAVYAAYTGTYQYECDGAAVGALHPRSAEEDGRLSSVLAYRPNGDTVRSSVTTIANTPNMLTVQRMDFISDGSSSWRALNSDRSSWCGATNSGFSWSCLWQLNAHFDAMGTGLRRSTDQIVEGASRRPSIVARTDRVAHQGIELRNHGAFQTWHLGEWNSLKPVSKRLVGH